MALRQQDQYCCLRAFLYHSKLRSIHGIRQAKIESATLPQAALCPERSIMPKDDLFGQSQPDAGPLKFICGMQPFEGLKDLVFLSRIKAHPLVLHRVNHLAIPQFTADVNLMRRSRDAEFHRVFNQIFPDQFDQGGVPLSAQQSIHRHRKVFRHIRPAVCGQSLSYLASPYETLGYPPG